MELKYFRNCLAAFCLLLFVTIWHLFIHCNWVSTRWQWSVKLYKNSERDSYVQKEKQYTKQYKSTEYTKYKTNIRNKKTDIKTCTTGHKMHVECWTLQYCQVLKSSMFSFLYYVIFCFSIHSSTILLLSPFLSSFSDFYTKVHWPRCLLRARQLPRPE